MKNKRIPENGSRSLFRTKEKEMAQMAQDVSQSIGTRIKAARQEKGYGRKELAEKVGCSEDYLEWVETDQVEPPVALLLQLATAMKLDSGTFLTKDETKEQRIEETAKRTEHYSYKTLTPPETDTHLMAFSVVIPPKTAHDGVGYRHAGEELVYVLSGEVELIVGDEKKRLTAKDAYRFNSNLDHHLSNPGNMEADLLVILYLP